MTDKKKNRLEDRLADFTDRLMAGETPDKPAASASGQDLESLQETVEKAQRVFRAAQPDIALQNRIRARLAAEWHKAGPRVQSEKHGWLSSRKKNQVLLLRLVALTATIAIMVGVAAPKVDTILPGAAQNMGVAVIVVLVVVAVVALILFWSPRKP
jgi:hypothetical protein